MKLINCKKYIYLLKEEWIKYVDKITPIRKTELKRVSFIFQEDRTNFLDF